MDGGNCAEIPLKACPDDETIAGTGALKVDTKVGTTIGVSLPEVDELEKEGRKPSPAARKVEAELPNDVTDELAPGQEVGPAIAGSGCLCEA